ncbi:MAG: FtsQ-type POTRA domain-containing protein, partial [Candidatus Zixiibacteriota bacterium]
MTDKIHVVRRTKRRPGARKRAGRRAGRQARDDAGRRKLATGLGVAAACVALAFIVYVSITSAPWRLGGYTVRGASYMTSTEVMAAAGFEEGDNLFWIDLEETEERLCRHPRIRSAEVGRRLPAEVVVTVEERPAAAAMVINDSLYKVSSDGIVLEPMAAGYEDLPVIAGARYRTRTATAAGKKIKRRELRDALAVTDGLGRVDPSWLAAVEFVDVNSSTVVLAAGRYRVRYASGFDDRTARRLRRVYEATKTRGRGPVTYDVRFGTDVIVTGLAAKTGSDVG